jgi:hypothetical protein
VTSGAIIMLVLGSTVLLGGLAVTLIIATKARGRPADDSADDSADDPAED